MKNPYGKSVPIEPRDTLRERAYAVYEDDRLPGWTWYVLKTYQSPDNAAKNPYARAFCLVTSPYTGELGDLGDTYYSNIGRRLVAGTDIRA